MPSRTPRPLGYSFSGSALPPPQAQLPGPGAYETNVSTVELRPVSATRASPWPRRWRNSLPMHGSAAAASLGGADRLYHDDGPAPGAYESPLSTFGAAAARRNHWESSYASRVPRFAPARDASATMNRSAGAKESRLFHRALPPRNESQEIHERLQAHLPARAPRQRSAVSFTSLDSFTPLDAAQIPSPLPSAFSFDAARGDGPPARRDGAFVAPTQRHRPSTAAPKEVEAHLADLCDVWKLDLFKAPRSGYRL
ncbi:hypothetical protein M885DRAFT_595916 [Pelagophyceae sp. CCMP2097]|nr:hypothetical protein M885DRAFT_595916 [Pelagophyceae sp. CCMP2097]